LVAWISVLVFVLVLLVAPVALPRCFSGVTLNGLLCVDAFEDTTFLYCVVGLRMKLAWPLQGFIVVFLIIASTGKLLDCVDFVVIVVRSFTPKIIIVVAAPIPPFSMVAIIIAPKAAVVEMSTVVSGVISLWRLLVLLGSSNVFSDELFCVVGIGIIFGRGEELNNRARALAQ
jgi:hypothetical protein